MERAGYTTFVLHSHLPYVRLAGRWPHGEEMLHEALAETYVPLLDALYDLQEEGYRPRLTLGLTPILLEQMSDPSVLEQFELYLLEKLELAQEDLERYERGGERQLAELGRYYRDGYRHLLTSFQERYQRDVVAAFRRLQEAGCLDIITSAATHAYLPLMERDSTLYAQLKIGIETYRRHFGRSPRGVWLPECGYRPAYLRTNGKSYYKPGLEEFLADLNLLYFFTDTHVIEGGELVGKVAGDAVGLYGQLPERQLVAKADQRQVAVERTTFRPYYVKSARVAVYGRDARTGVQVWSAAEGYPGDPLYREFHRRDDVSGLQYWRVTGAGVDLGDKELYHPYPAFQRAKAHAAHFCRLVEDRLVAYYQRQQRPGIVASAYDTELFGHWWYEGIAWLKETLRQLSASQIIGLTTADDYLAAHPPQEVLSLPESSWGTGGAHWTWLNPATEWIWPLIYNAERKMEKLVAQWPRPHEPMRQVLNQAARELLILEASDWPFLISTGQAATYAGGRFQQHLAHFNRLAMVAEVGKVDSEAQSFLDTIAALDNPFPDLDYHIFAEREQS